ncbi:MAG TPA: cupin domain-containing protein, partial [Rhodanobacteraceae bacterium]
MIEVRAGATQKLGMPPARFLRDYWQKKPLLIRGAFADLRAPLTPDDLAGLSCEPSALSRIVVHENKRDRWKLRTGPFDAGDFAKLPKRDWTLLVQDVDKWDADVAALLPHFAFLPRWRIDDIMVSYAVDGGSVGAHVDNYDVFLLQGLGQRRWMISTDPHAPKATRDDADIKLLRAFAPTHAWVLEAGDMLYLPPGVPHHGVAIGECMTYSVGMRAPSRAELLVDFAETFAAEWPEELRFGDPDLAPSNGDG